MAQKQQVAHPADLLRDPVGFVEPSIDDELGRLVAAAKGTDRASFAARYRERFMDALARMATTRKHTNVLMHMAGHFKTLLDADEKQELVTTIHDYRQGLVPLVVPLTLIRHHVRRHKVDAAILGVFVEAGVWRATVKT